MKQDKDDAPRKRVHRISDLDELDRVFHFSARPVTENLALEKEFTAELEDDGYRFTASFETDKSGVAHCVRFEVEKTGESPIGAMLFRERSVNQILGKLREQGLVHMSVKRSDGVISVSPGSEVLSEEAQAAVAKLRKPVSGAALEDGHLENVGTIYESAVADGLQAARIISNETGASMATAYRWIKAAKAAGYIKE